MISPEALSFQHALVGESERREGLLGWRNVRDPQAHSHVFALTCASQNSTGRRTRARTRGVTAGTGRAGGLSSAAAVREAVDWERVKISRHDRRRSSAGEAPVRGATARGCGGGAGRVEYARSAGGGVVSIADVGLMAAGAVVVWIL